MRRPLELRTTLTGFPARQFLDSAPSLSFSGASQFKAKALQGAGGADGGEGVNAEASYLRNQPRPLKKTNKTSYLFMCVSVWSKQCSPIRLFPERSRPPLPVYVNSSPRSCGRLIVTSAEPRYNCVRSDSVPNKTPVNGTG